jgi:hypothetical protein
MEQPRTLQAQKTRKPRWDAGFSVFLGFLGT